MGSPPSYSEVALVIPTLSEEEKEKKWIAIGVKKNQQANIRGLCRLNVVLYSFLILCVVFVGNMDISIPRVKVLPSGFNITAKRPTIGVTARGNTLAIVYNLKLTAQLYHPGQELNLNTFQASIVGKSASISKPIASNSTNSDSPRVLRVGPITFVTFTAPFLLRKGDSGFDACKLGIERIPLEFNYKINYSTFKVKSATLESTESRFLRCDFKDSKKVELTLSLFNSSRIH